MPCGSCVACNGPLTSHGQGTLRCRDCYNAERQQRAVALWRSRRKRDRHGCHVWQGKLLRGYGRFHTSPAHVWGWRNVYGRELPDGFDLHHTCGNRACVNPRHLVVLSKAAHRAVHDAARTHCPQGHAYDARNARQRVCKQCARDASARYRATRPSKPRRPLLALHTAPAP